MKRVLVLAMSLAIAFSVAPTAYATDMDFTQQETVIQTSASYEIINEDNIVFTPEEIAAQIEIDNRLRAEAASVTSRNAGQIILRGIADRVIYNAPVTQCQQSNEYYCGPASTKMVYEGLSGNLSHNQSWFATQLGTTTAGTSSSQIATTLKRLTGRNYSVANVSYQSTTDFYNNISNSLRQRCAVVVNVGRIPGRYTSGSGHFMVVHGSFIDTAQGVSSSAYYTYTDPHHNNKYYGIFTITNYDLYSAVASNSGNYVRVA